MHQLEPAYQHLISSSFTGIVVSRLDPLIIAVIIIFILLIIITGLIAINFKQLSAFFTLPGSLIRKSTGNHRSNKNKDEISVAPDMPNEDMDQDEKLLKGIVNFGNINVSAIMCPRIDVTSLDIKARFDELIPLIVESGFSRIPVYSGSFDSIKGILYAKDILPYANYPADFKWQTLLRQPYFVPETKKINDLLKEFQIKKIHMAIVIDEYGGTSGIVTLEDILEEIVGEITDESDEDDILFRKIDESTYIFEGKILLNDFCKNVNAEENIFDDVRGEAETLAGLILELTGEIPQKGQTITHKQFSFSIESADRRRIKEIRVEIKNENTDAVL